MSWIKKLYASIFGSKEERIRKREQRKKSGTKTVFGQFVQDFLQGVVGTGQTSFKEELEKYLPEVQTNLKADWSLFALFGIVLAAIAALFLSRSKPQRR